MTLMKLLVVFIYVYYDGNVALNLLEHSQFVGICRKIKRITITQQ